MSIRPTLITDKTETPTIITPAPRRICSMADMAPAGGLSRWESPPVSYRNAWTEQVFDVAAVFDEAAAAWNAICGVSLIRTSGSFANIVADHGNIDGSGGTLAYSYFPGAPSGPSEWVKQVYDVADIKVRKWFLLMVIHEFGHAIGIGHQAAGNLMAPYLDGTVTTLGPGDIAEAQRRYGKPRPKDPEPVPVPPTLPPATPKTDRILLKIGNQSWEIDARRLPDISGTSATLATEDA